MLRPPVLTVLKEYTGHTKTAGGYAALRIYPAVFRRVEGYSCHEGGEGDRRWSGD